MGKKERGVEKKKKEQGKRRERAGNSQLSVSERVIVYDNISGRWISYC